ncbi:acetyl-CoA carboxylase, carboxyltransferase subunit beta [Rubrivirga sp. S365]|uniref:Acetyl-coenzyme A carboxylase carboxyl transferase subunit beta n=1 Tax=Rubrivirga litoralis TaxID=3075598 RepID=A0ABU3BRR3_9BACT|nr:MULTISPECIES: acetyl-CoA carboxylase, carboxyltransferase subunit beta [unclassified Rubrivirga]MDT0631866.1 acetyl-CoA carboxylase, carboxyltransferase subunit beta [Rubrivirga sp. F394]MDT7857919.1 acetyl-CoA carboxylase, carboxyltransferase subunit beta [Rubrivirga sp. S365]
MAWFKRQSAGIQTPRRDRNETPEGYWQKCPECGTVTSQHELEENVLVCPSCGHHFPMAGLGYLRLLFDQGAFTRWDADLHSIDPLDFVDRKAYPERIAAAEEKTGLNDAVVSGTGTVGGHPMSIAAMDFSFIGGSMGSVVGEIITRAIRRAVDEDRGCLVISQSGGARMMEGALSLMQMAKTSANLAVLAERGLPYVSLLTHPTTGGVTASFAMLGDLNLAEPGALIGFAGPRVIRETIGRDLPRGFQTAEFLVDEGFVDRIVPRTELRDTLVHLLDLIREDESVADRPAPAFAANGQEAPSG